MFVDLYFLVLFEVDQVVMLQYVIGLDEDVLVFVLLLFVVVCVCFDFFYFNVGVIVCGVSGCWYFGGNMEFFGVIMQQIVYVEQSVISYVWLCGEIFLCVIMVNYMLCGYCCQFMNELNSGLVLCIYLLGCEVYVLEYYLLDVFGLKDLEIKILLMDEQDYGFLVSGDVLIQVVIQVVNCCYVFYSYLFFGVVLELKDGIIFSGSYVENVVFNLMLLLLQGVLNFLSFNGYDYFVIQWVILVEKVDVVLIQWDVIVVILKVLGCYNIECVLLG